jgi:hypothetical protein
VLASVNDTPETIATLPESNACVIVGPPLSCNGPSARSRNA